MESKLGMKGNKKMKQKVHQSIENEGMGIGFLDFLDEIANKVKMKNLKEYKKQEYDFNDDQKEVLLDEADLANLGGEDENSD